MRIAAIGTGLVGRTLAGRLADLGHDVVVGTRDVQLTLARTEPSDLGVAPYARWQDGHPAVRLVSYAEAGDHGEVLISATRGVHSLEALTGVGAERLTGKVLIDTSLPLDLSGGLPPTLTVANTDSLAEQIQRAYPHTRVVKTLTTVSTPLMVDPGRLPEPHTQFLAGNDPEAKLAVTDLLQELGWPAGSLLDLGDISAARGIEMYSRLHFQLAAALDTWDLNIAVVRA
jgi:8-hydroxy-5-deazaflavin:NADPH oxidoreductase